MGLRGVIVAVGVVLGGCAERQVSIEDDEPVVMPACMILPARGYWNDGSTWTINNERGVVGTVCMCMTWEEFESQVHVDELNDRGLAECNHNATLHHDFDYTDCQESYDQGEWRKLVGFAIEDWEWTNQEGLTCDEEERLLGGRGSVPGWALLLAAVGFSVLRRKSREASRACVASKAHQ